MAAGILFSHVRAYFNKRWIWRIKIQLYLGNHKCIIIVYKLSEERQN